MDGSKKQDGALKKIGSLTRKFSQKAKSGIGSLVRKPTVKKQRSQAENQPDRVSSKNDNATQQDNQQYSGQVRRSDSRAGLDMQGDGENSPKMPGGRMRGYSIRYIPKALTEED